MPTWSTATLKILAAKRLTNITVVGAFYNSTGTVVAVGYTDYLTPASLAPSKTVSFQIAAFDLNQHRYLQPKKSQDIHLLVQSTGTNSSRNCTYNYSQAPTNSSHPVSKFSSLFSASTHRTLQLSIQIVSLECSGNLRNSDRGSHYCSSRSHTGIK